MNCESVDLLKHLVVSARTPWQERRCKIGGPVRERLEMTLISRESMGLGTDAVTVAEGTDERWRLMLKANTGRIREEFDER